MAGDEGTVQYTVKELIGRLDAKMDLLLDAVDSKASVAALDRIDGKITTLEGRVSLLETAEASAKAVSSNTRWMLFTGIPGAVGLAVLLSNLI